jgi:hypothetical protein
VGVFSSCPLPNWSVFVAEYSDNLDGAIPADQIEGDSIGLAMVGLTCQTHMFVVPQARCGGIL